MFMARAYLVRAGMVENQQRSEKGDRMFDEMEKGIGTATLAVGIWLNLLWTALLATLALPTVLILTLFTRDPK